jgi:hypothetical protein
MDKKLKLLVKAGLVGVAIRDKTFHLALISGGVYQLRQANPVKPY